MHQSELVEVKITDLFLRKKLKAKRKTNVVRKQRPVKSTTAITSGATTTSLNAAPASLVKIPDKVYTKGLYQWYNDGKLKIDSALGKDYSSAVYEYKRGDEKRWDVVYPSGEKKDPWYQYTNMTLNIGKIERGEFNEHFDENVHRFHSVLTYCKKDIRHALNYDGEELVAIDLCNSQPYLSTVLFQTGFWDGKKSQLSISINPNPNQNFRLQSWLIQKINSTNSLGGRPRF